MEKNVVVRFFFCWLYITNEHVKHKGAMTMYGKITRVTAHA